MKKKIIMVLFIAVCLVMGGMFLSQKADASSYIDECYVPYCIKSGDWATGLHIKSRNHATEVLTICFWKDGINYAWVTLNIGADFQGQWTGMVQNLLPDPSTFQSASTLVFYSAFNAFAVSQFTTSPNGFASQTFFSYLAGSWMRQTTPSEPFSEPQGADGMPSYSDAIPYME